jgi:stage II sporulation protein D
MQEPRVSVGILNAERIEFVLYGDYKLEKSNEIFQGQFTAYLENDEIKVSSGEKIITLKPYEGFVPSNEKSDSFMIRDVLIGIAFHWQQKQNQQFRGAIKFVKENGKLTAVNYLLVEDYLVSVISSEMSANSSIELLKAHAIISRSWLFAQMEKEKEIGIKNEKPVSAHITEDELIRWYDREDHILYDVCADDHCQRYQGITKLYAHNAQRAVEETRGMVLTYNDKICDTRFSKSCGGISESFENVWEPVEHPYLKAIIDYKFPPDGFNLDLTVEENAVKWIKDNPPAFCNTHDERVLSQFLVDYDQDTRDFYRWTIEYTQEEISNLIKKKSGIDFGDILDFEPVERGYSGRLIKLKIIGSKKILTVGKELEIRKILSEAHLYSSAIVIEKSEIKDGIPQRFKIYGAGWGHGVGLCQIGAAVMSDMGYKFDEILMHYFKDTLIKKLYL